eukprot:477360_1
MVNVTLYPAGWSKETQSGGEYTYTCQHGAQECDGNMVETCFINLAGFNQNKFMDFIIAYETALSKNQNNAYATAKQVYDAGSYGVSWSALNACMGQSGAKGGTNGNKWEHQMILWTKQVGASYMPWITLDGKHDQNYACQTNTLKCTCDAYKGTNSCCSKFKNAKPDGLCYKNDTF